MLVPLALSAALLSQTPRITDQAYRWKSVAIVAGGFVSGILFHPRERGLAYCRTDIGGAYRWDDRAKRWIPLQDWLTKPDWNLYGVESIGLDPSDPKRLYLACGTYTNEWGGNGAILRSSDQGRTFQRTDLNFKNGGNEDGRSIGERLSVDPNDGRILYFGTRHNGLWISHDRGANWEQSSSFPVSRRTNGIGIGIVVFDPRAGSPGAPTRTIYVGVDTGPVGLYRSTDAGATWTAVPGQPPRLMPHHMVLAAGNLIVAYSNGPGPNGISGGAVCRFNTVTGTWKDISPLPGRGFGYAGLSVDPQDPRRIVVSTLDRWSGGDDVFLTTNGGETWSPMRDRSVQDASAAPYMRWGREKATFGWWTGALAMDPFKPSRVLYGTGANIWGSVDVDNALREAPTHWSVAGVGIEETADIDLLSPAAGPHLISALGDIGGFTHLDLDQSPAGGMTVNPQFDNADSLDSAGAAPLDVVRVGRAGGDQRHGGYSLDGGVTWKPFATEPSGRGSGGSVASNSDGSTCVWAPEGQIPSVSHDWGATWTPSVGAPTRLQLASDKVDPNLIYGLGGNGHLFVSLDSGQIFQDVGAVIHGPSGRVRTVFGQTHEVWIPADNGLFHSSDAGLHFAGVAGVDSAEAVGFGKAAPGASFPAVFLNGRVRGVFGVFRSDDAGKTWVRITDAKHEYGTRGIVMGDPRIYGRVYMGTNGRGVLYGDPR